MANRPLESIVRRIPLGSRILLTVLFYAVSVGALGFASWRMVEQVTDYRAGAAQSQNRAQEISDIAKKTARFQALLRSHLDQGGDRNLADVDILTSDVLGQIIGLQIPIERVIKERDKLLTATQDFYRKFVHIRKTNEQLQLTYADISKTSTSVTGLIRILARPIGDNSATSSKALAGAVQRSDEAFTRALVEMNAYYFSGDPQRARQALNDLNTMGMTVPVMKSLTDAPLLLSAINAIQTKTNGLIKMVNSLDGLFVLRETLSNQELGQSQAAMSKAIDALIVLTRETQKQSAARLEQQMRDTLMTILVLTVVLLLLGLLANTIIIGSIRRPILELQEVMQDLSGGNWDREVVGAEAKDEVGAMARTLDVFKRNTLRMHALETEKREELAKEKAETDRALSQLDAAHKEIHALAERLSDENTRLGAEIDVSRKLQEMLLPKAEELASVVGLDIATFMEPANEVGGDYFDVLTQGDRAHISIGDVTGHGLESGVVMLMTQSVLRTLTTSHQSNLPGLVNSLNMTLFGNLQRLGGDKNLTLTVSEYEPNRDDGKAGGTLRIAGQHESVLIIRSDGNLEEIDTLYLGMTIGLVDDVHEFTDEIKVLLNPGDTVIMYTDGITEAANTQGHLFGIERLKEICQDHHQKPVEKIKDAIIESVFNYANGQDLYDDVSLVVLKQKIAA